MKNAGFILLITFAAAQVSADLLARFRTYVGDIVVQLYEHDKPVTVSNFVRLVEAGAYSNNFFHRCEPKFIVQAGGFLTPNPASTNLFGLYGLTPHFGPITNEYFVGRQYSNVYGTIAMAKQEGNPDSATSQWFFNLANNSANLDYQNGGFTVFGRVVSGFPVLEFFRSLSMSNGIVNIGSSFPTLPVKYSGWYYPRYMDLIYVDISILRAASFGASGSIHTVTWEGATGLTNHLEASATLLPGSWTPVFTTLAPTGTITATVTNPSDSTMFYRIRAEVPE